MHGKSLIINVLKRLQAYGIVHKYLLIRHQCQIDKAFKDNFTIKQRIISSIVSAVETKYKRFRFNIKQHETALNKLSASSIIRSKRLEVLNASNSLLK